MEGRRGKRGGEREEEEGRRGREEGVVRSAGGVEKEGENVESRHTYICMFARQWYLRIPQQGCFLVLGFRFIAIIIIAIAYYCLKN